MMIITDAAKTTHPMDVIDLLGDSSSKSYKQDVLMSFAGNLDFIRVLKHTYDPKMTYHIKKLTKTLGDIRDDCKVVSPNDIAQQNKELNLIFDILRTLDDRTNTGKAAVKLVIDSMETMSEKSARLFYWILKRDLKCGIDAKSIYRALRIRLKPPYQGAVVYDPTKIKKLLNGANKGYVYAENKADGLYGAIVMNHGDGKFYVESRAGHFIHGLDRLLDDVHNHGPRNRDYVITGEIMVEGYDRFTANGIVNSMKAIGGKVADGTITSDDMLHFEASTGKTYYEMQKLIHVLAWDTITLEEYNEGKSDTPREERMMHIENLCEAIKSINMVNYIKATTYEEICEFFAEQLMQGLEGVIVKTNNCGWKDGKPAYQIKMKLEFVSDLKVVGFSEGEVDSKYEGSLGALMCESEDGLLITKVSGMTDHERFTIWNNKEDYLGKVVEIKCNGLSKARSNTCFSMMYANVHKDKSGIVWRNDKLEANTLKEIQEIEDSKKYGKS